MEVITPQLELGSPEIPSELATLGELASSQQRAIIEAREIVRCRQAYMGRYYDEETVLPWKPSLVHPKINEVVERFTAVLTATRVKFSPKPRNDEDAILCDALIAGADFEWERQRMDLKMQVASRATLIDGTNFLYTCVDSDLKLATKVLSPFSVTFDPTATSEDDAAYAFIDYSMSRNEIEKKWPEYAGLIFDTVHHGNAPIRDENSFNMPPLYEPRGVTGSLASAAQVTAGTSTAMDFSSPQVPRGKQGQKFRVREWFFTRGEDRELSVNLADGDSTMIQLPSTTGRCIYIIEGHYFPELDGSSKYQHGQIPLSRMHSILPIGEFLGIPYIQPGLDTAEQIADIDNQIMANVRLMMHPIWLVPFESRVDLTKFFSAPGMVLPYRAPHKPEAHTPPALPNYVFELRRLKQEEFDNAMGISDISRGAYSGSLDDVSGKAVQLLQRPSYDRMRPIQMSIEYAVTRWGQQTMCNMMQYTPEETWRRILPQEIADMPLPWLMGEGASIDRYLPDIQMDAGSNLPENQDAKNGLVFNLYDRLAFGPPGSPEAALQLLKGTAYPDAERIAQATGAAQQQAMMQQQMMGAQTAQPAPPAPPGGGNKALGGEASPQDAMNVMASVEGQEEGL